MPPHLKRTRWFLGLLLIVVVGACSPPAPATSLPQTLEAYGFIEAEEVDIAPQTGGRVISIEVGIGDEVEEGAILVRLDDRIQRSRLALAEAKLAEAEARLALGREGATDPELRAAEALLAQAQAGESGACQAWLDAQAILSNPQELERQIAIAQARVRSAEAGEIQAAALQEASAAALDQFERGLEALAGLPEKVRLYDGDLAGLPVDLPQEILDFLNENPPPSGTYRFGDTEIVLDGNHVIIDRYIHVSMPVEAQFIPNQYWQAWIGVNTTAAATRGLRSALALLIRLRQNPRAIRARVDAAEAACRQAMARNRQAQAQVDGLRAGATRQQLAVLEAQVAQAQAELEQARIALSRQTLTAPVSGVVLEQTLEVGELALPSVSLLKLGDLDMVYLTVYLSTLELGRVSLGSPVLVKTDSHARLFSGEVVSIGQEAEFPPSAVPQAADRASLVFAVRVRIPNPEHSLRPGTFAEASFQ